MLPWERSGACKVPLTFSNMSKLGFTPPLFFCSSGVLESLFGKAGLFYKGSLIHGCLPKVALSRFSPTKPERDWAHLSDLAGFITCREICLPIHKWKRLLLGPLAYGAGSHDSHRGTFVHGWMPKFSC